MGRGRLKYFSPQITQLINDKAKTGFRDSYSQSQGGCVCGPRPPRATLVSTAGVTQVPPAGPNPQQRGHGMSMSASCTHRLEGRGPAGLWAAEEAGSAPRAVFPPPQFPPSFPGRCESQAALWLVRESSTHLGKQRKRQRKALTSRTAWMPPREGRKPKMSRVGLKDC